MNLEQNTSTPALAPGRRLWLCLLACLVCAVIANVTYYHFFDQHREVLPDASFYLAVAKHLATAPGYVDPSTPWPTAPTVGRMPGWPLLTSFALRLFPQAEANGVIRYLAGLLNIIIAPLLAFLTWRLSGRILPAFLAGAGFAVYPSALYFAELGLSETSFVLTVTLGILFLLGGTRSQVFGMFLCGFASLIRSNFLLFGPFYLAILVGVLLWRRRKKIPMQESWTTKSKQIFLLAFSFAILPGLWLARNYSVSGIFPMFSSIQGETLYGAHNELTFYSVQHWGYWVFPDEIPGQEKKSSLAKRYSEIELSDYYAAKSSEFIRQHRGDLPRLILGKLVRGFIPIPWQYDLGMWGACLYRILLYVVCIATIAQWRQIVRPKFLLAVFSIAAINFITVVVFYGSTRFSFAFEPFLLPLAAIGVDQRLRMCAEKRKYDQRKEKENPAS